MAKNPYIVNATANKLRFTVAFKEEFWARYERGESTDESFRSMSLDPDILGKTRIKGIVRRIKQQGLRGIAFSEGYHWVDKDAPADESQPVSQRFSRLEHELAYAKQELKFIKKNYLSGQGGKAEMLIKARPDAKFGIIREMTSRDNNLLNIRWLCDIAGVSCSGYYRWLSAESARTSRDEADERDFQSILEAYNYHG